MKKIGDILSVTLDNNALTLQELSSNEKMLNQFEKIAIAERRRKP